RVSTVETSIVTSTLDLLMSASSKITVPFTLLKPPRTVEIARCFTENCAAVCAGSICHVVVAAETGSVINAARPAASVKRVRDWPIVLSPLFFSFEIRFRQTLRFTNTTSLARTDLSPGLDRAIRSIALAERRAHARTGACAVRGRADRAFSAA